MPDKISGNGVGDLIKHSRPLIKLALTAGALAGVLGANIGVTMYRLSKLEVAIQDLSIRVVELHVKIYGTDDMNENIIDAKAFADSTFKDLTLLKSELIKKGVIDE